MASSDKELEDRLMAVGTMLASPPADAEELYSLLDQAESVLMKVAQSPSQSVHIALRPAMNALIAKELLEHSDRDVKVALASCLSEITRITAPDAPYDDDVMKVIFQTIVASFDKLDDLSRRTYPKAVLILETVAKVRSCVVMLDLELDALILEMFHHILNNIRPNHSTNVFASMHLIMTLVLEESEDISADLLSCLLNSVKKDKKVPTIARSLAEKVISHCALKLKPYLMQIQSSGSLSEYSEIVSSICQGKIDALEQNEKNVSGETLVDDSKLSERTVSNELPQGSVKTDQEASSPEKVDTADKSPGSVMNNGNVLRGDVNSIVEPASPKQNPEQSRRGSQPKHNVVADKGHSDNLEAEDVKLDSTLDIKIKKTKGRKPNTSNKVADINEHSLSSGDKEAPSVPSKPKYHSKEADSSQVGGGPFDREAESAAPIEPEDNNDIQPPYKSDDRSVSLSSPTLSENILNMTRPKRGRSCGSKVSVKRAVNAVADQHVSTSGEQEPLGNSQILDESLPSDSKDIKEPETISISEEKPHRRTGKKVQREIADVEKTASLIRSSEAKPAEMTAKRGSRNKIKESDSPGKNQKSCTKQPKEKVTVAKDASGEILKNMPSPKSDTKIQSKDDSHLVDRIKTQPKRKRPRSIDEISETPDHEPKLDQTLVGSRIKVWWPDDNLFYDGKVDSFDPDSGKHTIVYNDGDEEVLLLREERFEVFESGSKIETDQDVPCPIASPEESQNKKAKGNSGSKQGKTRTTLKSRPGSNEDDINVVRPKGGPKSVSSKKSKEKRSSKSNNNTPKTSSKLKSPRNKSKDDTCPEDSSTQDDTTTITTTTTTTPKTSCKDDTLLRSLRKPKAETQKTSSNLKVNPKTNSKLLDEDTPKSARSKSKNDSTSTPKQGTHKSNSSEYTPKVGRKTKAKGDTTSRNGAEYSPENGKGKVQVSEPTKKAQGSPASTGKKRGRKGDK